MPPKLYAGKCKRCLKTFHSYEKDRDLCGDSCNIRQQYDAHFGYNPERNRNHRGGNKVCEQCNQSYQGNRNQRYCSQVCSRIHRLESVKKHYDQDCHHCKKPFETTHKAKKYCSATCRIDCEKQRAALNRLKKVRTGPRKHRVPLHVLSEWLEHKRINGGEPWLSSSSYRRWVDANKAKKERGNGVA